MGPSAQLVERPDRRLARRASRGDTGAIAAIFERYRQELYGFCLGLLGEPQDAQDALQNTMVKVLRSLPGEEREIALRPWLYRIAHNEAIELRRGRHPMQALEVHLVDEQVDVPQRAEYREQLKWVLKDLADLPERQRTVLVMRELSGLDFAEIGAALDTTGAVVRQSLYEARRNLEQMDRGRSLRCEAVTRVLSAADGRKTRRRDIRAHVRDCPDCRRFRDAIGRRGGVLSLTPVAALTGMVKSAGAYGTLKAAGTVAAVAVVGTVAIQGGIKAAAPDPPSPDARHLRAREDPARSPSPQGAEATPAGSETNRLALSAAGPPSAPASAQVSNRRPRSSSARSHRPAAAVAGHPPGLQHEAAPVPGPPAVSAEAGPLPEKQEPEQVPPGAAQAQPQPSAEAGGPPAAGARTEQAAPAKAPPGQVRKEARTESQPVPAAPPPVEAEAAEVEADAPPSVEEPEPNGKAKGHEK